MVFGVVFGVVSASTVTPVQKVLEMLLGMKAQGNKELQEEREVFVKYEKFVSKRSAALTEEIADAKALSEKLVGSIAQFESDAKALSLAIKEAEGSLASMTADREAAMDMRKSEHAEFVQAQMDYGESLYAIDHALEMLAAQAYDRPQAELLLQRSAMKLSGMRRVVAALRLMGLEAPTGAPSVAAYESQAGGIIEMLKNLEVRFKKELGDLEVDEMNREHAHQMQIQDLAHAIATLKAGLEERSAARADAVAAGAAKAGELKDVKGTLAEAESTFREMRATFVAKNATFEANQKVRADELAAIEKAISILSSPEVADSYARRVKALPQLGVSTKASPSFLQVRGELATGRAPQRGRAAVYLQEKAKVLGSQALAELAAQMSSGPFAKVIDMIEALLARLKEEAASEADHKAFCDEELAKSKVTREKLGSKIARVHAQAQEKAAEIMEMAKEIEALAQEQAALQQTLKEATEVRHEEKEENLATIKDAEAGKRAVGQAIVVLKEFYAAQLALLQSAGHARQAPEMEAYKGMQRSQGGVIGMLGVIEADFERVAAMTRSGEEQAAVEYEKLMTDGEAELNTKSKREFKLKLKKDQAEFDREQLEKDLSATQDQLHEANAYFEELKPQCVAVHVSFEERARKRQEEIEALKEAYTVISKE